MMERKFNVTMNEGGQGCKKRLVSDLIYDEFVMINIQYDNKLNLHNCFTQQSLVVLSFLLNSHEIFLWE